MDILFFIVAGAFTLLSLWITVSGIRAHEKSEIVPGLVTLAMGLGFFVLYLLECWMALAVIFLLIGFIACSFTTMWFNDLRNSHERARLYVEPTLVWVYGIASYLIAAYAFECNGEHLTLYTIIFSI